MTDLKNAVNRTFPREDDLREAIELLFFAYRDFTGEPDAVLTRHGYGRAHHRVLYFVGRHPGISVSELLAILRITKQSLSRVLSELLKHRMVVQHPGASDRRRRHLGLSDAGAALLAELSALQMRRLARAYREAGPAAVAGFRQVMVEIIGTDDRARFDDAPTLQAVGQAAAAG